jgi:hypothetical protein
MLESGMWDRTGFGYVGFDTAPEQYLGNPDFRSDLYSLGVTVIKCLTGKVPDELKDPISGKQYRIPKELAIPKPLRNLLQSMINREVDKRPKSAEAALKELEKIINKYSTNGELNVSLSGARIISTTISAVRNSCRSVAQKVVGSIIEAKDRLINAAKGLFSSSGEVKKIDDYQAVDGKITVNGQQIDTLLLHPSFEKKLEEQIAYAEKLGYRLATSEDNKAYLNGLLEKEANDSINEAELEAIKIYRKTFVRDTEVGLNLDGRRVRVAEGSCLNDSFIHDFGALFVRAHPNIPSGNLKEIDGYQAVEGQIRVNSQQLDTLMSEGSFNKTRDELF